MRVREVHNLYSWKGSSIGLRAKGDQMRGPLRPSPALIKLALWGSGITAPQSALRTIGAVGFESIRILLTIMHSNIL